MSHEEMKEIAAYLLKLHKAVELIIENSQPQQVFMNSQVMPGVHYKLSEDFLINNYFYTINTNIPRVLNNEHSQIVELINKQDDILNVDAVKKHLIRTYKLDCVRYLSNWCNLSFSEN